MNRIKDQIHRWAALPVGGGNGVKRRLLANVGGKVVSWAHNCSVQRWGTFIVTQLTFWYTVLLGADFFNTFTSTCMFLESCFRSSLTHRKPPLFCQQGYLKKRGVVHNGQLWQHVHDAGLMSEKPDGDTSGADAAFPNYLAQAGASLSSGLKLDLWLFFSCVEALPMMLLRSLRLATSSTYKHFLLKTKYFRHNATIQISVSQPFHGVWPLKIKQLISGRKCPTFDYFNQRVIFLCLFWSCLKVKISKSVQNYTRNYERKVI